MARTWTRRQASPPTSITEIARRYHAAALALAQTLGVSLSEVLTQHRESVTAIFIETSHAELRLPAGVKLPPLTGGNASATMPQQSPGRPEEVVTDGDPRPMTIPLAGGLPCAGLQLQALKPGQLAMLLSKTASLVHEKGDHFVPLLAALQREKARRLEPGRTVPVQALVPTGDIPDHPSVPAHQGQKTAERLAEAPTATATAPEPEVAERQRWGAMSRRSLRVGLSPTVWESLRSGPYADAERVILALEQASPNGTA